MHYVTADLRLIKNYIPNNLYFGQQILLKLADQTFLKLFGKEEGMKWANGSSLPWHSFPEFTRSGSSTERSVSLHISLRRCSDSAAVIQAVRSCTKVRRRYTPVKCCTTSSSTIYSLAMAANSAEQTACDLCSVIGCCTRIPEKTVAAATPVKVYIHTPAAFYFVLE